MRRMPSRRTVVRGGIVVDGVAAQPRKMDLAIHGGMIVSVGEIPAEAGDIIIEAEGRYVLPGFIDTHTHADGAVFREDVQRALLTQGITTVIGGQDGVSYAPGNGSYASEYFAALNGPHPTYSGGGVAALLASYDNTIPVNVGYLVPAGTVRHEICGQRTGRASQEELMAMAALIEHGMADGALGLSTGLDYVPGIHQDTSELIEMCKPVAAAGGLYVTHMRGGYEQKSQIGTDEITDIAAATGVSVHISHYHGPSQLLLHLMNELIGQGVDISFDAYPYRRGCTLLAMPILPASLLSAPRPDVLAALRDNQERARLLQEWFPTLEADPAIGPDWPDNMTVAHAGGGYEWAQGMTLGQAASRESTPARVFTLNLLLASKLEATVIMKVRDQRPYDDLARLVTHSAHTAGSDGIYIGTHPHPRAWGTFSRFLRLFMRERGDYSLQDSARHLSTRAAERFCLTDRGRLRPGYIADLVLVDALTVSDRADYDNPRAESVGISDVLVAGQHVLAAGELTGINAGVGIRRHGPVA